MALSDDIKERLDIVEVVGGYVPELRRSGRNYVAPCPFHTERTGSFYVFPDRQSWRCFGACATGGDVLSFVMRMEKLTFSDTLRTLAPRVGLSLTQPKENPQRSAIVRVNEATAAFFQEMLRSQQGIAARAYLQQRGLDVETIRRFQLGLSPGTGHGLLEHLQGQGYTLEQLAQAGLVTRGAEGLPPRDMFLGRVMFPIHDAQGNLAGFGGRSLDGAEPKYLNTPRTEAFDKGHILYAFHRARASIREAGEGVIVEGYMDAIAAHQHGYENVVASMGTALTEPQVMLLKGVARRFVMALDADAAGQQATFRSLRESWQALKGRSDVSLRVLLLPYGKDPDELIRHAPQQWQDSIAEATPLLDYLLSMVSTVWDLTTGEGKQMAWRELKPVVYEQGNVFDQDTYLRKVSEVLETSIDRLRLADGTPVPQRRNHPQLSPQPPNQGRAFEADKHDALEEHFLAMLLRWPELRARVKDTDPDCLQQWENREIFTKLMDSSILEGLSDQLENDLRRQVAYLLSFPVPPVDLRQREQAFTECIRRLEERRLRNLKREEASLLAQASDETLGAQDVEDISKQVASTNERLRQLFHARVKPQRRG